MALKNITDLDAAQPALAAWLSTRLGTDVDVEHVEIPASSGLSAETLMFTASWNEGANRCTRDLVARIEPSNPRLYADYDLAVEFEVMRVFDGSTDIPVPEVLFLEPDPAVLGAPFMVMERLEGRVPADDPPFTLDGWVLDLPEAQQARLYDNALRMLATIHAVDPVASHLQGILTAAGRDVYSSGVSYWADVLEQSKTRDDAPVIDAALAWLHDHRPEAIVSPVVTWGDARIGNLLFDDHLAVVGVIDWEMVSLAPPEQDLGWWFFILAHHSEGLGVPLPPGFPPREQAVERYEELSGHRVRDLLYREVFAGLRAAIISLRAANAMMAAGLIPADSKMGQINPATRVLARLIGVPQPTGETDYYIGKR